MPTSDQARYSSFVLLATAAIMSAFYKILVEGTFDDNHDALQILPPGFADTEPIFIVQKVLSRSVAGHLAGKKH